MFVDSFQLIQQRKVLQFVLQHYLGKRVRWAPFDEAPWPTQTMFEHFSHTEEVLANNEYLDLSYQGLTQSMVTSCYGIFLIAAFQSGVLRRNDIEFINKLLKSDTLQDETFGHIFSTKAGPMDGYRLTKNLFSGSPRSLIFDKRIRKDHFTPLAGDLMFIKAMGESHFHVMLALGKGFEVVSLWQEGEIELADARVLYSRVLAIDKNARLSYARAPWQHIKRLKSNYQKALWSIGLKPVSQKLTHLFQEKLDTALMSKCLDILSKRLLIPYRRLDKTKLMPYQEFIEELESIILRLSQGATTPGDGKKCPSLNQILHTLKSMQYQITLSLQASRFTFLFNQQEIKLMQLITHTLRYIDIEMTQYRNLTDQTTTQITRGYP